MMFKTYLLPVLKKVEEQIDLLISFHHQMPAYWNRLSFLTPEMIHSTSLEEQISKSSCFQKKLLLIFLCIHPSTSFRGKSCRVSLFWTVSPHMMNSFSFCKTYTFVKFEKSLSSLKILCVRDKSNRFFFLEINSVLRFQTFN